MNNFEPTSRFLTTDQELKNYIVFTKHFSDLISRHKMDSGEFIYASQSSERLIHLSPYDLYGQSLYHLVHPNDREHVQSCLQNVGIDSGKVSYRLRRNGGDYVWVETTYKKRLPSVDEDEKTDECLCITRNITDIKMVEEDLKDSEHKYRTLVEHSHDTIGIMSFQGHLMYINESGKRLLGVARQEEVLGQPFLSFIDPKDKERVANEFEQCRQSSTLVEFHDIAILRTDQETRQADVKLIPTDFRQRKTLQIVIQDITERKKIEEMLQQAEKLSVIGQLAAGIAHEIRNPLTAIKGFTQLLKNKIEDNYSRVILQELDRIENIVSDLLILAKPQVVETVEANLIDLLKHIITLLGSQAILHNISIEFEHQVDQLTIRCEPDKLKQVFINFIKNAIEAMNDGGKILVSVAKIRLNKVQICFTDEGVGIPKERLEKLGEPFYSTKEKGTGLGLMICQKIITSHKGSMSIDSVVGEGTTISVSLPVEIIKGNTSETGEPLE